MVLTERLQICLELEVNSPPHGKEVAKYLDVMEPLTCTNHSVWSINPLSIAQEIASPLVGSLGVEMGGTFRNPPRKTC